MIRRREKTYWFGWFYDETWRANIEIIWPVGIEKLKTHLMKFHDIADYRGGDDFDARCLEIGGGATEANLICLRNFPRRPGPNAISHLAHEALHATEHILTARGVHLTRDCTEPHAYLLESIMRRCLVLLDTSRPVK